MKYSIAATEGLSRFIRINAEFPVNERVTMFLQLAAWRPGRYEIANFSKNIRGFQVYSQSGEPLPFRKVTKDCWEISCEKATGLRVSYEYYAAVLDAGSTFCGKDLLYGNPVNCLVYDPALADQPHELWINVPGHYEIACALPKKGKRLFAANFDQLADSPFIASPALEKITFEEGGCTFYIWIRGRHTLNTGRFVEEAKRYTREQIAVFGDIESKEYHYLYHFLPTRYHHGVEHCDSTVIVMGPGESFHEKSRHNEFLAISSHELFHYWNIKRIRPESMLPYDLTKENYSQLGYIYEGITTYYGDYMLLRSRVFSFEDYLHELNGDLQKHFDNEGRYRYSVAESSWDTWLDGYTPGIPGRKVSIYTEGMLAALMLDIEIRSATGNKKCLDDVLYDLYHLFYKKGKGYNEDDFKGLAEKHGGKSFDSFFRDFYHGKGQIEKQLPDALLRIGCVLETLSSGYIHEQRYGFRFSEGQKTLVTAIQDQSPAEQGGLSIGDEILLVNNIPATQGADWNNLFSLGGTLLAWNTVEGSKAIELMPNGKEYFQQYRIKKSAEAGEDQKAFFKAWSKWDF
jgi:predicted metalloprotease with PDZ domain